MSRSTARRKKQTTKISKKPIDYIMEEPLRYFKERYTNDVTRNAYVKHYRHFINWCINNYNIKNNNQVTKEIIQNYVDFLVKNNKTASTVHTYLAPICVFLGIDMSEIEKPKRYVSCNIRSRSRENKYLRKDQCYENEKFKYVADFQKMVGIRRSELAHLTYDCLVRDESGYDCILVKRGKGGKKQLQRILPQDVNKVKEYFGEMNSGRLFSSDQFSIHMDYHHLRAQQAQRAYKYYYDMTHTGDSEVDRRAVYKLTGEIIARWNLYNLNKNGKPRRININKDMRGSYVLRGKNRNYAIQNHLPTTYDRLCVMAVSVFHLSHWRLDTLCNYLL